MVSFDLAPLKDAENALKRAEDQPVGNLIENLPFNQLDDKLRFGEMGGTPPFLRAGVPRIAFMKLAATGVLAGLAGMMTSNQSAAFSCAIAAAVNFIACIHYWLIWRVRAQHVPAGYSHLASGRNAKGEWVGRSSSEFEDEKVFAQELAVDGLRHSDWAVTLPLLVLDLYDLSETATSGAKPWLDKYLAAALIVLMVFLGAVYRFYANELRAKKGGTVTCAQLFLGTISFLASCVVFALVLEAILHPISNSACGPTSTPNSEGLCEITDDKKKNDALAVQILAWSWVGYPVVSFVSRLSLPDYGFGSNGWVGFAKDVAYAILDVTAKGGMCLYVSFRTTWI